MREGIPRIKEEAYSSAYSDNSREGTEIHNVL